MKQKFKHIALIAIIAQLLVLPLLAQLNPAQIYERNWEATVKIIIVELHGKKLIPTGMGSGFIVTPKGHIFTNRHVIEGSAYGPSDKRGSGDLVVQVWTARDKYELYMAKVDYYSTVFDGAQVSIVSDMNGNPVEKKFKAVTIGDADKLVPGQNLVILGYPAQYGQAYAQEPELVFKETSTLTLGIVSGYDNVVQMFKTDSKIDHGNSGGPVFNDKGEVVGIATAQFTTTHLGLVGEINNMYYVAPREVASVIRIQKPSKSDRKIDVVSAERYGPDSRKAKPGKSSAATDLFGEDESTEKGKGQKSKASRTDEPASEKIEITGTVRSADTGNPIDGATLAIVVKRGQKYGVLCAGRSNRKGKFVMEPRIVPGEYEFVALAEGYEKVVETVKTPKQDWEVKVTMNKE